MIEVMGCFEAELATPIEFSPTLSQADLNVLKFTINNAKITIAPLKTIGLVELGDGDYEFPKLTHLIVAIVADIELAETKESKVILSKENEHYLEDILIDATRRFVLLVRHKTKQWHLETQHPIHSYRSTYWGKQQKIETTFPLNDGSSYLPRYAQDISVRDFYKEMSLEIWQGIPDEINKQILVETYEEFFGDAIKYRRQMHYDLSILNYGIGSELLIERTLNKLMKSSGYSEQRRNKILEKNNFEKVKEINKLSPEANIDYENLRPLFDLRNSIAHGDPGYMEICDVDKAADIAWLIQNIMSEIMVRNKTIQT